jgi:hypothetical protein
VRSLRHVRIGTAAAPAAVPYSLFTIILVAEPGPALFPPRGKHFSSVSCPHSFAEAVFLFALELLRLIRSFQEKPSLRGLIIFLDGIATLRASIIAYRGRKCQDSNSRRRPRRVFNFSPHYYNEIFLRIPPPPAGEYAFIRHVINTLLSHFFSRNRIVPPYYIKYNIV